MSNPVNKPKDLCSFILEDLVPATADMADKHGVVRIPAGRWKIVNGKLVMVGS